VRWWFTARTEPSHVAPAPICSRRTAALLDLSVASKFAGDWDCLHTLRVRGRAETTLWLARNYDAIGECSSIDLGSAFLDSGAEPDDGTRERAS